MALVPGANSYSAMLAADGQVYTAVDSHLYVFDPQSRQVVRHISLSGVHAQVSLGRHRSGALVGLTSRAVYVDDPAKGLVVHTAPVPTHIGCGFALTDEAVYFASEPTLWRYWLPRLEKSAQPAQNKQ